MIFTKTLPTMFFRLKVEQFPVLCGWQEIVIRIQYYPLNRVYIGRTMIHEYPSVIIDKQSRIMYRYDRYQGSSAFPGASFRIVGINHVLPPRGTGKRYQQRISHRPYAGGVR